MADSKRHPRVLGGDGVDWHAKLIEQLSGPTIPPDAVCAAEIHPKTGKTMKAVNTNLLALVKSGAFVRAWGRKAGDKRSQFWYWPK